MKKISDKGLLSIQIDGNNKMKVVFKPMDGNVWMDRNELCELFGCYMKDVDKCLETVFKKNRFRVEDTCRYHIIAGGKCISYDITDVNLTVIIALAFIMATPQAEMLRLWVIERILTTKNVDFPLVDIEQNFWLN